MKINLVISALGKDKPGILSDLSRLIAESGCNILDSRVTVLGSECAGIFLVVGNWSNIAKLEDVLRDSGNRLGLIISSKRTEPRATQAKLLPYMVELTTVEQPGVVSRLAEFFASRTINIEDLYTGAHDNVASGTPLLSLTMTVNVPAELHISELREQFMDLCEELNLDGVIEPLKR